MAPRLQIFLVIFRDAAAKRQGAATMLIDSCDWLANALFRLFSLKRATLGSKGTTTTFSQLEPENLPTGSDFDNLKLKFRLSKEMVPCGLNAKS